MNGFNLSESAHFVCLLTAQSISGGKTSLAFSMKGADHASIILQFAAMGALVPTSITLNQVSNAAGANPVAIPFRWYNQPGGQTNDIPSGANYVTAAGIITFPATVANYTYFIEVDSAELGDAGLPYLQVVIADSGNATTASMSVILSALHNSYLRSASVTV